MVKTRLGRILVIKTSIESEDLIINALLPTHDRIY